MLGSLAFLCWVAPHNHVANFIGAGFGGMGFLNLSLDWSNITARYSLFLTPWWTQVVMFIGFAFSAWVLMPAAKFGHLGEWNLHLNSNRLFLGRSAISILSLGYNLTNPANGTSYPITQLLTPQVTLNETAYAEFGPPFVGTQVLWNMFFDYAAYTSAIVWMACFGWQQLHSSFMKVKERVSNKKARISEQYDDQLSILQRSYEEVPAWWFGLLFAASLVALVTIIACGKMFIPVWTYFVAVGTGAILVVPLGWLYALSNFQLPIGTVNELLYGLMVNSVDGYKNPVGATVYSSIAVSEAYDLSLPIDPRADTRNGKCLV
jgi:hypothetical protein